MTRRLISSKIIETCRFKTIPAFQTPHIQYNRPVILFPIFEITLPAESFIGISLSTSDMTGIKINQYNTVIENSGKNKQETLSNADMIADDNEFARKALSIFYKRFFSLKNAPERTKKHIASPDKNSTCKRLNMYLRWMVRHDNNGVDFGIWKKISAADLICPVDLHVARVARGFGLDHDGNKQTGKQPWNLPQP